MTIVINTVEGSASEIVARLRTLTVDQGAETDIGTVVHLGYRHIDEEQVPCVMVVETEDESNMLQQGVHSDTHQHYEIYAFLRCDPASPNTAAHKAIRDLKRAIFVTAGRGDRTLGRKVARVNYHGRAIAPRADSAPFVCAAIEVSTQFCEDLSKP